MPTILALTGPDLIERLGAFAGIAAIPGLAILALLYFAQAREVRRLRDWAGRSPERDAELQERAALAGRYNVAPPERQPAPSVRPVGPARPATAAAAAAGAGVASRPATAAAGEAQRPAGRPPGAGGGTVKPAGPGKESRDPAAVPVASTAAAQSAARAQAGGDERSVAEPAATGEPKALREGATPNGPPDAPPVGGPDRTAPAVDRPGPEGGPSPADRLGTAAATSTSDRPGPDRPGPGAGPPVVDRPGAGAGPPRPGVARPGAPAGSGGPLRPAGTPGSPTALRRPGTGLPPRAAATVRQPEPDPERSSGTPWLLGLGGVGALALLVAIVVAIVQLDSGGGEDRAQPVNTIQGEPAQSQGGGELKDEPAKRRRAKPLVRSEVTVVVLNGTTVPGLAATIADKVEQAGFTRGQEADNSDQQVPSSSVLYGPGQKRAGQEVAKVLDVSDVRPLDAGTQAIAGADATVVVVVGVDKTP